MNDKLDEAKRMIPKAPDRVVTIDDDAALKEFVSGLASRDWIAVDTEFLRERTYYPKLCLVQIADADHIGLIDVLALSDLGPLAELLNATDVCKVFHSAEQDLEVLYQTFGELPAPIFDTQVAAPLLGFDDQMGYARLIDALLNTKLAKGHTRTDWSKRPLPEGALEYAADDVRYLAVAYQVLRVALSAAGRLDWLAGDFERMAEADRFRVDPNASWRRIKAWNRLTPAAQQVLAELADWRERAAMAADRPRRWILADTALIAIAENQPARDIELADTPDLPAKTLERHGNELLACVARGLARPAVVLDANAGPPDEATRRRIKTGMRALTRAAEAADIPPAAVASRADIAAIVAGQRDGRLLRGWRAEVAGHAVVAAIESAQADAGKR